MLKVMNAFRERYHDMKLYKIGDEYPGDDSDRVQYLVSQGFLSVEQVYSGEIASGGIVDTKNLVTIDEYGLETIVPINSGSVDTVSNSVDAAVDPEAGAEPEKPKRSKKGVNTDGDPNA